MATGFQTQLVCGALGGPNAASLGNSSARQHHRERMLRAKDLAHSCKGICLWRVLRNALARKGSPRPRPPIPRKYTCSPLHLWCTKRTGYTAHNYAYEFFTPPYARCSQQSNRAAFTVSCCANCTDGSLDVSALLTCHWAAHHTSVDDGHHLLHACELP